MVLVEKKEKSSSSKVRYLAVVAILSAISAVLMFFEFTIPFIAPGFYKFDLSEVPVIVGAFAMGPVAGVVIEIIKIILHLFIKGTSSAFIGEFGNLAVGIAFVVPASLMYYMKKTKKTAILGLVTGTITTTIVGCLVNAYLLLPFYAAAFGGIDNIIAAGTAVNCKSQIASLSVSFLLSSCVDPFGKLKFIFKSFLKRI